ncbi:MAG: T9SS type A sorting domain-containing protein [Bacteroidales bacterium]|nr:T9SS type A sorting domain-containing protein [Bacteroidales bacterium]
MPRLKEVLGFCVFLVFALNIHLADAQISYGGKPVSSGYNQLKTNVPFVELQAPDTAKLLQEDRQAKRKGLKVQRIGVTINSTISMDTHGTWERINGRGKVWRMGIEIPGARALGLYYDKFKLPQGAKLFVYDENKNFIIGSFDYRNNSDGGPFATEAIPSDKLVIEYFQPSGVYESPEFQINGIMYAYKGYSLKNTTGFGDSGDCEVNIHCPEGEGWYDEKKGVVKIITLVRGTNYLCTGSLVNNTEFDFAPLLLTANHCAKNSSHEYSTESEMEQWTFYFNYETDSAECQDPFVEPDSRTMTGGEELAKSGEEGSDQLGSDFFLMLLNDDVPPNYDPYFNGWDASGSASDNGVTIHHPQGDIKKISTYSERTSTVSWDQQNPTHWSVNWAQTQTNHGVTEPGSSGAPLFSEDGLIMGMLTGGGASCGNPTAADYFGKFSYSWTANGDTDDKQLKPWLDPNNTGVTSLEGSYITYDIAVAQFKADTTIIPVETELDFTDQSLGDPTSWNWTFEGATPSGSTEQNPTGIQYNHFGDFQVKLEVENENNSSIMVDTIQVKPVVYPNPVGTGDQLTVFLGEHEGMNLTVRLMNTMGQTILEDEYLSYTDPAISLDLGTLRRAIYILEVRSDNSQSLHKIVLAK